MVATGETRSNCSKWWRESNFTDGSIFSKEAVMECRFENYEVNKTKEVDGVAKTFA